MEKVINKYIAMLFGALVIMLSFPSCTDQDDIDIKYHHNATIEINTLNLYETSGIDVVRFQTLMGTGIYKPCITLLIYNPDGSLNKKEEIIADDLRPITYELQDMDQLEYTFIAVQHFVIVANGKTSSTWTLEDEENIENVHISVESLTNEIYWFNCLGIDVQKIIIKRDSKISIQPKLAGSFVNLQYENLDKSAYNRVGFYFKDKADGLYLNPNYTGNDRYYYKYGFTAPNIWSPVAIFYSESGLKESDGETRFIFETGRVNCCIGLSKKSDKLENGGFNFTAFPSTNNYTEFSEGGFYTAYCYYNGEKNDIETFIGEKSGLSTWYNSIEKWIIPIFDTPYISWGGSVADVKSYMENKGYNIWFDVYQESNGLFYLGYDGKYSENSTQYIFATEDGDLLATFVNVAKSDATTEQIIDMINNNTQFTKIKDYEECYELYGCYVYINNNTQIEIYPDLAWPDGTPFTQIGYYPRTYQETAARERSRFEVKDNFSTHLFNRFFLNQKSQR